MEGLGDIISSLNTEDIEMLKGVASSILGGEAADKKAEPAAEQSANTNAGTSLSPMNIGLDGKDFEMIMKAKSLFDRMNSTTNKNVDLIMALKPHLSKDTQDKADAALRMLKLFEVLPLLRELF